MTVEQGSAVEDVVFDWLPGRAIRYMIAYALTIAIATQPRTTMTALARLLSFSLVTVFVMGLEGVADSARSEVTGVNIVSRADVLGGQPFGAAGAYEKIVGAVFFALDPALRRNDKRNAACGIAIGSNSTRSA
jgi:hypothetical protein